MNRTRIYAVTYRKTDGSTATIKLGAPTLVAAAARAVCMCRRHAKANGNHFQRLVTVDDEGLLR
jgi:hypothetical protein